MPSERPVERRPARWVVASPLAPVIGLPLGVFAAMASSRTHFPNEAVGFWVWSGVCSLGLLAAVTALARGERLWGLAAFGLLLNAAVILLCAFVLWSN